MKNLMYPVCKCICNPYRIKNKYLSILIYTTKNSAHLHIDDYANELICIFLVQRKRAFQGLLYDINFVYVCLKLTKLFQIWCFSWYCLSFNMLPWKRPNSQWKYVFHQNNFTKVYLMICLQVPGINLALQCVICESSIVETKANTEIEGKNRTHLHIMNMQMS